MFFGVFRFGIGGHADFGIYCKENEALAFGSRHRLKARRQRKAARPQNTAKLERDGEQEETRRDTMYYNIFFSPTGATEKIVKHIGQKLSDAENIDISDSDLHERVMNADDFCVVGVPSFGGRVPAIAAARLQKIKGSHTPALLLVTYGGRAYEDTLKELKDILEKQNFICVGAAAMVTEHSIVREIGAGRPAAEDYEELDGFLIEIEKRLRGKLCSAEVPGNTPYKGYKVLPMEIRVAESCTRCGLCAEKCPVKAIPEGEPSLTDGDKCISCMRCVNICPIGARTNDPVKVKALSEKLKALCQPDKKNEFF